MLVQEVMTVPVISIQPSAPINEAARIMLEHRVSGLPVVEADGSLVGIISEGDFLRRQEIKTDDKTPSWWQEFFMRAGRAADEYVRSHARTVSDVMTRKVLTLDQMMKLSDAVKLMDRHHIKRLPVVEDGRLIGILSRSDLMRIVAQSHVADSADSVFDDEAIRQAVMKELSRQPRSGRGLIHVAVDSGKVRLTGTVYDESTRVAARVAAENVSGVKSVDEQIDWIEPTGGMFIYP